MRVYIFAIRVHFSNCISNKIPFERKQERLERYGRGGGFRVMELLDRATFNFYLFRLVTHPYITEYNFYLVSPDPSI